MSKRIFIGVKDGDTPVIKVMKDTADDPRTTTNDSWSKFLFNSEVDQLPYARLVKTYDIPAGPRGTLTFLPAGTDFNSCALYFIIPSSPSTWAAGQVGIQIDPTQIWTKQNCLHFMRIDVAGYFDTLMWEIHGNYGSGDWGQIIHGGSQPEWMILPAIDTSSNWHVYGGQETYFSDIVTTRLVPIFASNHIFTDSELSALVSAGTPFRVSFYELDMPVNEDDYPLVVGTPAPGKKILKIAPGVARMAKPGFDVDTATDDQMLFSETKVPLAIIKTGLVTLAAGAQTNVELGQAIDPTALIDYQIGVPGATLYLPSLRGFKQLTQVRHRISGTQLQFMNDSDTDLEARFFVMAKDSLGASSGSAKVLERTADGIIIRRPSTGGTNFDDVIYDSRWAYMPIVAQGWVPFSSFVADTNGGLSRKRYTLSLTNDGTWKPYVMARLKRQAKSGNTIITAGTVVFKDFLIRQMGFVSHHGADSNFMAAVQDTQVDFYCGDGTDYEAAYAIDTTQSAYLDTLGLRYYVMAVPNSL